MRNITRQEAFTLVELLIVLSILAILMGISFPLYTGFQSRAAITADLANVRALNEATASYRLSTHVLTGDIFSGLTDQQAQNALFDQGHITTRPRPQYRGGLYYHQGSFHWNGQHWVHPLYHPATDTGTWYDFTQLRSLPEPDWIITQGDWVFDNGLRPHDHEHRVMLGNPHAEYTIIAQAALGPGSRGGYGIMFETTRSGNQDTGLILQFDRGMANGELIIRQRTNGREDSTPLFRFTDVPNKNDHPNWWSGSRQIQLSVTKVGTTGNRKVLSVVIDGKKMFDWEFEGLQDARYNYTGFRTWHEGRGTVFENLRIIGH